MNFDEIQDYKLYAVAPEISRLIRDNTDPETGEISEDAVEKIVALEEHAEIKIHNCGQVIRSDNMKIESIKEEIKKLREHLQKIEKHKNGVEQYLIKCAEALNIDKVFIGGRTTEIKMSRESVEVDNIDDLDPEFVLITQSVKISKRDIRQNWKSTGKIPAGARIVRRKVVRV